ncbi:E-selectin isoform X2 [Erinaceus europaeus]|uniref:E-selectin isoform X2 n=1 Tax=Erinaceus europaeus TaxID=9365 RepID=A0ABM3XYL9_ERIEU|nr:E-selectin isoform X2 [Erinaceus europaeus]
MYSKSHLSVKRTPVLMAASCLLKILTLVLFLSEKSRAWSYHASTTNMTFDEASAYCQEKYTHLVAIQNQEEIQHLNSTFVYSPSYYWIGIRKINKKWTWIGTQKPLTKEAQNWAPGEPNNKRKGEDCVEIYIKRELDSGKWNDERCDKKKLALCYTAACTNTSCSGHGECVETINSYTCRCHPGFSGLSCEQVVTCQKAEDPKHGSLSCTHPWGNFSYNSSCNLSCQKGYLPSSTEARRCMATGEWSTPPAVCKVVECDDLTKPTNGSIKCSQGLRSFPWNSTCSFGCENGFELSGAPVLQCSSSGNWDNEKPTCEAVVCVDPGQPQNGSVNCSHSLTGALTYRSSCKFTCEDGFQLQGATQVECTAERKWTQDVPVCEAVKCDTVRPPQGGFMNCSHPPTGNFTYTSSCVFSCDEGFELQGSAQLECSSQGQWTQEIPSCQAVSCASLEVPAKAEMNCSGEPVFGAVCTFACPQDWVLNGSAALKCEATGHWSGISPTCEAPTESEIPLAVGLSAAATSLLTLGSFLLWLLKRLWLRKKARKFTPASCQSLESDESRYLKI